MECVPGKSCALCTGDCVSCAGERESERRGREGRRPAAIAAHRAKLAGEGRNAYWTGPRPANPSGKRMDAAALAQFVKPAAAPPTPAQANLDSIGLALSLCDPALTLCDARAPLRQLALQCTLAPLWGPDARALRTCTLLGIPRSLLEAQETGPAPLEPGISAVGALVGVGLGAVTGATLGLALGVANAAGLTTLHPGHGLALGYTVFQWASRVPVSEAQRAAAARAFETSQRGFEAAAALLARVSGLIKGGDLRPSIENNHIFSRDSCPSLRLIARCLCARSCP